MQPVAVRQAGVLGRVVGEVLAVVVGGGWRVADRGVDRADRLRVVVRDVALVAVVQIGAGEAQVGQRVQFRRVRRTAAIVEPVVAQRRVGRADRLARRVDGLIAQHDRGRVGFGPLQVA